MIKDNIIEVLHEMEEVTKLFKLEPFDIYIIGGSACILGEYTTRATIDVDFIDLGYPKSIKSTSIVALVVYSPNMQALPPIIYISNGSSLNSLVTSSISCNTSIILSFIIICLLL